MPAAGQFKSSFSVQPDYHYEVQTSANLLGWAHLTTLLATNTTLNLLDMNLLVSKRFYRVVTQP
jgi:hypothetical protein